MILIDFKCLFKLIAKSKKQDSNFWGKKAKKALRISKLSLGLQLILLESKMIGNRLNNTFHKEHFMSWATGKYKTRFGIWRQKNSFLNKSFKNWTQWVFCLIKTAVSKLTLIFNSKNWMTPLPKILRENLSLKRNLMRLSHKE